MSGSVNKVILVGRVGKEPEIRFTQSGTRIANFSLATSENWKDKQSGEKREKTEWTKVVVFADALSGIVEKYVRKGAQLYIEGKLQTRKWQDQSGNDRYSTEVVLDGFGSTLTMLDGKSEQKSGGDEYNQDHSAGNKIENPFDDDIPF